jgi:DNA polymerase-3 subunit epsilon
LLEYFHRQWLAAPLVVIDTECTGKTPGVDVAVSFGLARFEGGEFVGGLERLVNPGRPIPAEATAVHGITDAMVSGIAEDIATAFREPEVTALLSGAQPAAYNAAFDRHFVPPFELGAPWDWPWIDPLMLVRKEDAFVRGKKRHTLSESCSRWGVQLTAAHSAGADARACGELLYKMGRKMFPPLYTLGEALYFCRRAEVTEWFRFNDWKAQQPAKP